MEGYFSTDQSPQRAVVPMEEEEEEEEDILASRERQQTEYKDISLALAVSDLAMTHTLLLQEV